MKRAYVYKGYSKDNDVFDLECINWQYLEWCLWFTCYYDLASYVLELFTDWIVDLERDEKLKETKIDRDFIEEEIDKIRRGEESLIEDYVDVIDCENVAKVPKCHSNIWYFLY